MTTKERIIQCAIRLFNEKGSFNITTNHIAEDLMMSPGNLYYHFRSKDEIIQVIFAEICKKFSDAYTNADSDSGFDKKFIAIMSGHSDIYYSYRFFYLELITLLSADPLLKKAYIENNRIKGEEQKVLYRTLRDEGIIVCDDIMLDELVNSAWILSEFWPSYLFSTGQSINRKNLKKVMAQIYYLFRPYINPEVRVKTDKLLESFV